MTAIQTRPDNLSDALTLLDASTRALALANAELDRLRRAVRALDERAPEVLASVTPEALRAVLTVRGWEFLYDGIDCEFWRRGEVAPATIVPFLHNESHGELVVSLAITVSEYASVAPAELLAEVLAEVERATPAPADAP